MELGPFTVIACSPLAPQKLKAESGPCFDIHIIAVEGVGLILQFFRVLLNCLNGTGFSTSIAPHQY